MEKRNREVSTTLNLASDCCPGTSNRSLSSGFGSYDSSLLSRPKKLTGKTRGSKIAC